MGVDVQLVPMYTPIQTDEDDVSIDQVFFGGINVYLQQCIGLFRYLPKASTGSWIVRRCCGGSDPGVSRRSAAKLGDLTLSMLRGSAGFQRKEVQRLCQWLDRGPRPDLLVLTNVLVAGCVPDLKRALQVPVAVTLQGDDLFLEELPAPDKTRALDQIRRLAEHVDAFLVHSRYYAGFMAEYLGIDPAKFHVVPVGNRHDRLCPARGGQPTHSRIRLDTLRVGYLARLAPEKGLHVLVDAFIRLKELPDMAGTQLLVAGWLGKRHEAVRGSATGQTAGGRTGRRVQIPRHRRSSPESAHAPTAAPVLGSHDLPRTERALCAGSAGGRCAGRPAQPRRLSGTAGRHRRRSAGPTQFARSTGRHARTNCCSITRRANSWRSPVAQRSNSGTTRVRWPSRH